MRNNRSAFCKLVYCLLLAGGVLALLPGELVAAPEYKVTLDSVFAVSADDVAAGTLFYAPPQVYLLTEHGRVRAKVLNARQDFRNGLTTIQCQWRQPVAPGTYDLYVRTAAKGSTPVKLAAPFQVNAAVIETVTPASGVAGDTLTVRGKYFTGTSFKLSLKVAGRPTGQIAPIRPLQYADARARAGRSAMDLESGASELSFLVPPQVSGSVAATLVLATPVGVTEFPLLPAAYDLREHGLLTPVKNQNGIRADGVSDLGSSVGLCWAFAGVSAFESSLLKQGYQTDPQAATANLSPWYLGNYIGYNNHILQFNADLWEDPIELEPPTTYGYLQTEPVMAGWGGGGGHWICDYITGGQSLVLWQDAPMPTAAMSLHQDLVRPAEKPSCGYIVKEMLLFEPGDYASPEEFRRAIKKALLVYGGVQSYVHLDAVDSPGVDRQIDKSVTPYQIFTGHRFLDKEHDNYYCSDESQQNQLTHAVCLAGWDDHRAIDVDGHTATGAWLIKDSLGAMSHDQGYYWVAFADTVLLKGDCPAYAFVAHPGTGYLAPSSYQTHAGALSCDDESGTYYYATFAGDRYQAGEDSWAGAQFQVRGDAALTAIGLMTMNRQQRVTVHIYANGQFPPAQGAPPLGRQSFTIAEKGYHLLDLKKRLPFRGGDHLTVVVSFGYQPDYDQPVVYVMDAQTPMPPTFWASGSRSGPRSAWTAFPANSAFYVQAVFAR